MNCCNLKQNKTLSACVQSTNLQLEEGGHKQRKLSLNKLTPPKKKKKKKSCSFTFYTQYRLSLNQTKWIWPIWIFQTLEPQEKAGKVGCWQALCNARFRLLPKDRIEKVLCKNNREKDRSLFVME